MPRRRLLLVGAAAVAVFTVALLVALPEVVRRVAVSRMAHLTGRAVTLDDVDLNLFTGRLALKGFRLAQRASTQPALEFDRLDVSLALTSLVSGHVRVPEVRLEAPRIFVTRTSPGHYDFDDLLALIPPPDPNRPPSTTTVSVARLSIGRGVLVLHDGAVTPGRTWRIEDLAVDGAGVSTRAGAAPGTVKVTARINKRRLAFDVDSIDVVQTAAVIRISVQDFELEQAIPYVPPTVAVLPTNGRLTLELRISASRTPDKALKISLGGDIRLDELALTRRGADTPLLKLARLSVAIKEVTPLTGAVVVSAVEIEGLDLTAVRDRHGQIDLLSLARAPEPDAAAPPPPAPSPGAAPAAPLNVLVERIALTGARGALRDETVTPAASLVVSDLGVTVTNLTWPNTAPLGVQAAFGLPGAGRVKLEGSARLTPFSADVTTSLRDASIEPYHPYLPIRARFAGRFNGDSKTRVAIDGGRVTATSTGRSWIEGFEVRDPADNSVPIRLERFEIAGIDFGWPTHARAATITATKPSVRIERDAAGEIRLRDLFTPGASESAPAPRPEPAPPPAAAAREEPSVPTEVRAAGGAVGFPVELGAVVIDDGYVQFLDRTVQPAFSETLSRLAVRVEGLSSTPGRRAKLTAQAIVGGDAALDVHGELAPLGQLYADIEGELRDFTLTRVNPYADSVIAWVVDRGKLGFRFHYKIERDQIEAKNEIKVENLHVAPSRKEDEVKKKIGLPLGLIVALVTDADNGLKVSLPINGPLASWKADLSDAIWTVVKNVAVNIIASPFRAIGRLFKGKDDRVEELRVEPVVFPPGAADVPEAMQRHLTAVADFLRRAPAIRLTLSAVAGGADLEALKGQELTARLQARQRASNLPDFAAAVTAEFKERFPDVAPPKPDEQLARLRAEEPAPTARLPELLDRRVGAVREGLVKTEGVPADRLRVSAPGEAPAGGEGRVEFHIGQ